MSVIGLNLWINYQVLKSAQQQLHSYVTQTLTTQYEQIIAMNQMLAEQFQTQINKRDTIIRQLKYKLQKQNKNNANCIQPTKKLQWMKNKSKNNEQYQKIISEMSIKYENVVRQNKQYEIEFAALIEQMKSIKIYLQQLKKVRDFAHNQNIECGSPARRLALQEQQQILTKMGSLSRLNSIKLSGDLDVIREVTQISVHSDEQDELHSYKQNQQNINNYSQRQEQPAMSKLLAKSISRSRSFECTNQVYDITNLVLNSRQLSSKALIKNQTLAQSLGVLKNYQTTEDISIVESRVPCIFTIPSLQDLFLPNLRLKDVTNQRYLIFDGGYVYVGNTIISIQGTLLPMGFGQLFLNNELIYCGQWKNGLYDGWGKISFTNNNQIQNFNGKWQRGLPHGPGTIVFANCQKFSGTFVNGSICGQGTYFKQNRRIYQGYWQNNSLVRQQI